MNTRRARYLLLTISLLAALLAAELAYRAALFGSGDRFQELKDPSLYADYFSEDLYWKLQAIWSDEHQPPRNPHPLLGWKGTFAPDTLRHHEMSRLAGRRPVLLYGDSFAACFGDVACFEDILNADLGFASGHYLLNYGVGGYGLDQTYLLFRHSIEHFEDPFVVLSLFTYDLDRSVLSFRIGQKPRFAIRGGELALEQTTILPNTEDYLAAHPPRVLSYLYRRVVFGGLLPRPVAEVLRGERSSRERKLELGERILDTALSELESRNLDFVFLVFHGDRPSDNSLFGGTDWREEFLRQWLEANRVPHIWSKDLVAQDRGPDSAPVSRYLDPETLHPTEHFNRLVAEEIVERVLEATP